MIGRLKNIGAAPDFDVRQEWPAQRLWRVAKIRSEKKRADLPLLSVFLGRGVIAYGEGGGQVHKPGKDLSIYQVVHDGDFVLNNQQAWRGSVGVSRHLGIISPAYVVLKLDGSLNRRFADYLFQSHPMVAQNVTASKGVGDIQRDIHIPWLKNNKVSIPPPDEQSAIVRFLDHAIGRIERAIRAKKKLIALLNEKKQAIIHRAVTRGLDPNVKLKPSGIPWQGEAPSHWTWTPIKQLLSRMDYGTSEISREEGRIRILTMGNIQRGEVILPKSGGLNSVPDMLLLEHNDLLFTRTNGNPDLVGKVGIFRGQASDKVSFASYLVRLRVRKPHDPQWLHMVLNSSSFWPFARSYALMNLQTNLNSTRYGKFAIPVPPPEEQTRIVEWVETESLPVAAATHRTEREIDLLREYRTRLIADVVTGKLDVREAAKRLPEGDAIKDENSDIDEAVLETETNDPFKESEE